MHLNEPQELFLHITELWDNLVNSSNRTAQPTLMPSAHFYIPLSQAFQQTLYTYFLNSANCLEFNDRNLKITTLTISVRDAFNRDMDLNNTDFSFILRVFKNV